MDSRNTFIIFCSIFLCIDYATPTFSGRNQDFGTELTAEFTTGPQEGTQPNSL